MAEIDITIRVGCGYKQKAEGFAHGHYARGFSSWQTDEKFLEAKEGSKEKAKAVFEQKLSALQELVDNWLRNGWITKEEADEIIRKFKEDNGMDLIEVTKEFEEARGIPVTIPERVEVER